MRNLRRSPCSDAVRAEGTFVFAKLRGNCLFAYLDWFSMQSLIINSLRSSLINFLRRGWKPQMTSLCSGHFCHHQQHKFQFVCENFNFSFCAFFLALSFSRAFLILCRLESSFEDFIALHNIGDSGTKRCASWPHRYTPNIQGEILGQRKYRFRICIYRIGRVRHRRDTIDPFVNFPVSGTRCIDPGSVRSWSTSAAALVKVPPSRPRSSKIRRLRGHVPPGILRGTSLAAARHLSTSDEMPPLEITFIPFESFINLRGSLMCICFTSLTHNYRRKRVLLILK